MSKIIISLMIVACSIYLTGCMDDEIEVTVSEKPDAEEVLRLDKNADIFQWDGLIYKTEIDWVDEMKVTKKELVGEIAEISNTDNNRFKNGMANKLPVGATIYSTIERGDILIVEYDGKIKKYLGLGEG
ncbi:hypothetical protein [Bacillus sp. FJAT-22090]|uniref:hypothetical protein n=1 Tax=Bacillus sp. FJAT-22090 TaxID=1581038 RepID=UPI0011A495A5|nr:hypothetical protein [Bacillus sp. FJAT-22090]